MRLLLCASLIFFARLAVLSPSAVAESYAEKLGWKANDRVLIVHSDDVGMSHASNVGTLAALRVGTVTSLSMMMPCPWVPEFGRYAVRHKDLDVGLHITMTSEWDDYRWGPVAGKLTVPGLADEMGCLWDNNRLLKEHATPDEVETEIRAQIDRAETMGIGITHLDSHMYALYSDERYFQRFMKVAVEKQLPFLVAAGHLYHASREAKDPTELNLFKKYAQQVWDAGLPVIDDLHRASYSWDVTHKKELYMETFRSLRPGLTEMVVHCTAPNDVIPVVTGNRSHLYGDYYAFIDPDVKQVIEDEKIILTTWRELKKRRDNVGRQRAIGSQSSD
jgi:hypothetical protein